MHLAESSFKPPLQNAQHIFGEKKKKNKEVSFDEVSKFFLSMLQKNMKLTQQNALHATSQFLSHASNANNDSNFSFEPNQEIDKPKFFSIDKDNYSRSAETTESFAIKNNHSNVKEDSFETKEETKEETKKEVKEETKPAEKLQNVMQAEKKEQNREIALKDEKPIEKWQNVMQTEKKEQNREIALKDEKPIEKFVNVKLDQAKSTQGFDDLLSKMKNNSDAKVKKTEQEFGEVGIVPEKNGKEKIKAFRLNSRLSFVEKNSGKEESQAKQFNTQIYNQLKFQDQNLRLGNLEKQIDQVSGFKNQLGKNSLNTHGHGEYSFSETTNTQTQVRNSRFSKLLQNSNLKSQLNEQFQSMLHRARILIKDQKNAFLSTNLHPKELGTVSLKLSMMDGHLNGLFTVENEAVQKLITEKMDKMLSELREDGYRVTSFNVDVRSNHSSSQENNMQNQDALKQNWFSAESEEVEAFPWQDDFTKKTGRNLYA